MDRSRHRSCGNDPGPRETLQPRLQRWKWQHCERQVVQGLCAYGTSNEHKSTIACLRWPNGTSPHELSAPAEKFHTPSNPDSQLLSWALSNVWWGVGWQPWTFYCSRDQCLGCTLPELRLHICSQSCLLDSLAGRARRRTTCGMTRPTKTAQQLLVCDVVADQHL